MNDKNIKSGLKSLRLAQNKDGSFDSISAYAIDFEDNDVTNSPFYSSLILSCLNELPEEKELLPIKKNIVSYLLSQKSKDWSFNYWTRGSTESKSTPYPDDLDATFCALGALYKNDTSLFDGKVMAEVVELLTLLEVKEGGPYRTWLVPESAAKVWKDIDLAVNCNIAYFLSLIDVELPSIIHLVEKNIRSKKLASPYYVGYLPIIFFISRFYKGSYRERLIELATSNRVELNNPLGAALAVISILNLSDGVSRVPQSLIDRIISSREGSGWNAYPFVIEEAKRGKIKYAGASALTTALCMEALFKYNRSIEIARTSAQKVNNGVLSIQKKVIDNVKKRYKKFPVEISAQAMKMIKVISKMDTKNQITFLPFILRESLGKKGKMITDEFLIKLGEANMYGWIAYTIYDDFFDDEGAPLMLPVANIALREMTKIFYEVAKSMEGFEVIFQDFMDRLDGSNAWEIMHCRYAEGVLMPDFEDNTVLASKSIGIILGPVAVLLKLGYSPKSPEVKSIISFFTHYLIARQLNDDAHDWEVDLKKGHITPVVAMLRKSTKTLNSHRLQEIFWYKTIDEVCSSIDHHIDEAIKLLREASFIQKPEILNSLLIPIQKASKNAREERSKTIEFISSYKFSKN